MSNLSLYQIASEHRAMVERLMATNDDEQSIKDTIEAESYDIEQKMQSCGYAVKNLRATAEAIRKEAKAMLARADAKDKRADNLEDYMLTCAEIAGKKEFECNHFAIKVKLNPEILDVYEESKMPGEFFKAQPSVLDKASVKQAIKEGREVPGAMLARTKRLEIK